MATVRRQLQHAPGEQQAPAGADLATRFEAAAAEPTAGPSYAAAGSGAAVRPGGVPVTRLATGAAADAAPEAATPLGLALPPAAPPAADAHTSALHHLLSSLRPLHGSGMSPAPLAASLPASTVRGPSLQQEAAAAAATPRSAAAPPPRIPLPAPSLPREEEQERQQHQHQQPTMPSSQQQPEAQQGVPAGAASFLQRVLSAANGRSSSSSAAVQAPAPAAAPAGEPSDAELFSRSSSARTSVHLPPPAAPDGSAGGPSYAAAMVAASEVAREIDGLRQLAEQPPADAEAPAALEGTSEQSTSASAAGVEPCHSSPELMASAEPAPAAPPAHAPAAADPAAPAASSCDGGAAVEAHAGYSSPSSPSRRQAAAATLAGSPASVALHPRNPSVSADLEGSAGQPNRRRQSSSQASHCASQDPSSIDAMLAELEASTAVHGSAAAEQASTLAAAESDAGVLGAALGESEETRLPAPAQVHSPAAAQLPSVGERSGGSGDGHAAPAEQAPAGEPASAVAPPPAASRLLGRLVSHAQHDSVGSVADEGRTHPRRRQPLTPAAEAAAAATAPDGAAEGDAAGPGSTQTAAAAQAADLAQQLLLKAHSVLQLEAASAQAAAEAAQQAATNADAACEVHGKDQGAAAAEASALHAAVQQAQLAATLATQRLAQLEQDVQAAAAAAAEALRSPGSPSKAAAAKAATAARVLRTALKWGAAASAAGGSSSDSGPSKVAAGGQGQPSATIAQLLPAAESLLGVLDPAAPHSSIWQAHGGKGAALVPHLHPNVQQVWRVEQASPRFDEPPPATAPASAAGDAAGEPAAHSTGLLSASAEGQISSHALVPEQLSAFSLAAERSTQVASLAVLSGPPAEPQQAAAAASGALQSSGASSPQLPAPLPSATSTGRMQRAAAVMLGKAQRALDRAEQAGEKVEGVTEWPEWPVGVVPAYWLGVDHVPILSVICRAGGGAPAAGRVDGRFSGCGCLCRQVAQAVSSCNEGCLDCFLGVAACIEQSFTPAAAAGPTMQPRWPH